MTEIYKKYYTEYMLSPDKKTFIRLVHNRYKDLKISSIDRKWYSLRKSHPKKAKFKRDEVYLEHTEKPVEPHRLKQLLLVDLMRFSKGKVDEKQLKKYGFSSAEILWVEENIIKLV